MDLKPGSSCSLVGGTQADPRPAMILCAEEEGTFHINMELRHVQQLVRDGDRVLRDAGIQLPLDSVTRTVTTAIHEDVWVPFDEFRCHHDMDSRSCADCAAERHLQYDLSRTKH